MAGMNATKTGTTLSSWQYYVTDDTWLQKDLRTDISGSLVSNDLKTLIHTFKKSVPLKILSLTTQSNSRNSIFASVRVNDITGWVNIKCIRKPTGRSMQKQEEQERLFVREINKYASRQNPITVTGTSGFEIPDVVKAAKYKGLNRNGKQQYADVILTDANNRLILISMKELTTPSLFGGGLSQLKEAGIDYLKKVTNKALDVAKKDKRFKLNERKRVDIYIRLRDRNFIKRAIVGSREYGGPCDYIFVGPKRPRVTFEDNTLTFGSPETKSSSSALYSPDDLMKKLGNNIWLRLRSRGKDARAGIESDPIFTDRKDADGVPLFWVPNEKSNSGARFVIAMSGNKESTNYLTVEG